MSKLASLTTEKIMHLKSSFSFPNDWWVTYAQLAFNEVRDGTHDSPKQSEKGVPLITSKNLVNGSIDFKNTKTISFEDHLEISKRSGVSTGDLLFSMIGTIGNVASVPENTNFSVKNVGLFRKNDSLLNRRFSFHWLNSQPYQNYLEEHKRGGNQKFVSLGILRESPVPIAPLAEQKVIAEKLDTLLAQVENTKARLERIPQILKRFRQSVLTAAVSGRLTEEWRSGDNPEQDFKKVADAGVAVKTGPFGSALHKSDYVHGGIPVINPMHISEGIITPSDSMTISQQKYYSLEAWHLRKGDIIVGRRGEMGRAAVVDSDEAQLCGTSSMLLRAGNNALPKYLEIILRSPTAVSYFNSASVGSTMVNLNQKVIKNLEVYFPPLDEQTEIVRSVDQLFAHADRIEQQVNQALARVNNLTQSILAKAFRGELTEQWRKDNSELISGENSAEALLERIKAERAAKSPAKRRKRSA
ncbi:restriction endonuclease subunit S [Halomonas vilamensis]|uniref:Restriction endonuclease subunit S n=1 Tax=Vreelandella vilamensis TaxID=531309 RepID=A0ABU1H576_9GAMM|nr:restriction endonuclease subunit S [Halomonas vilamensis]MDR5899441.1 restriction endonuclease subunit S [Halomonas vilamensis]